MLSGVILKKLDSKVQMFTAEAMNDNQEVDPKRAA